MKLIAGDKLQPGVTYYIEKISKLSTISGKKIGVFNKQKKFPGLDTIYAEFINLKNIPNASRPSGLGETSTSVFNTQDYIFYLPENDSIYLRNIIDNKTNTTSGDAAVGMLGGKRKSRKFRKSRKSRKFRKSRKSRKSRKFRKSKKSRR